VNSTLLIALALGMRHGTDPDHLTAIDGLSRIRPRVTNGLFFALGHGVVVTLLAVGVGGVISDRVAFLGPWVLILIGVINLWRVFRPAHAHHHIPRPLIAQPFLLGMLLAAGFETASQFAALILTNRLSPWLVGSAFTLGMVVVDGLDGYLAASTQYLATAGSAAAATAARLLGVLVVAFSFGLGGAELIGFDLDRIALPTGLLLFATVITIRIWARTDSFKSSEAVPVAS
jgi:nickel/cobalt transporter (NiCoT) family protein